MSDVRDWITEIRARFKSVQMNDATPPYNHHQPRKSDGMRPRQTGGGSCWLTPKEIAANALNWLDAYERGLTGDGNQPPSDSAVDPVADRGQEGSTRDKDELLTALRSLASLNSDSTKETIRFSGAGHNESESINVPRPSLAIEVEAKEGSSFGRSSRDSADSNTHGRFSHG